MASSTLLATLCLRFVLPLVFVSSSVFRPCGLSLVYLLLFIYLPLVPALTKQTFNGNAGRYLRVCLVICFLTVISQICFQVVLLALPPYGGFLKQCELTEKILRHLGFVKLSSLSWVQIVRWLGPDAVALSATILCYVFISNLFTKPPPSLEDDRNHRLEQPEEESANGSKILSSIGTYLSLGFLCFTSSLQPSVSSGIYYLVFLTGANWWALSKNVKNRAFAWIFALLSCFVFVHILALYLYQLQWAQELLAPDSQIARLAGLVPYFEVDCNGDPRNAEFSENLNWAATTLPFALLFLFHLLVYETKTLMKPEEKYSAIDGRSLIRNRPGSLSEAKGSRLSRRQTIRWHGKSSRRLMTFSAPRSRYGSTGRSFSGDGPTGLQVTSTESIILSRGQSVTSRESGVPPSSQSPMEMEMYEYDGYTLLLAGLFSIFDLFAKSSYIATNIIMMAWSITYHSWLTFILLLWACVLWMFPNQRKAMLVSSPGLVLYAELLLLAQYVYSLNLTDDELPQTLDGINFAEIGLVKPKDLACFPILVKSLYTMMFWITLRQFVMERNEKRAALQDAAQESFRITVSTTPTGGALSELQRSRQGENVKSGFMVKLGNFLQDVMTKFWIWVVAIMLFVIGLGGDKVVLYRIVYMALFLVFILTFQLSYGAWRKMMYGFWLTVIVYSMLVLVLIYTYQFEDIPQYLSNYTGIPDQLQKDIGLEKYDTGSLFVRLLTPTFFVVITVVQLHYFHKDFLKLSDMPVHLDKKVDAAPRQVSEEDEPPPLIDEFTMQNLMRNVTYYGAKLTAVVTEVFSVASEISWRFLEIHIMKIVLFSAFMLTVYDNSALHFVLFLGVINGIVFSAGVERLITHLCSIFISILLLAKMIYQIDYISHSYWDTNCTIHDRNITGNDAKWLGLVKNDNLPDLLKGYIGMILVVTLQAVVRIRQKYQRHVSRVSDPGIGILFPEVERRDADVGLLQCLKFMFNYGFYKFGVEITLVTLVSVIGTRLDLFSVLYSLWLVPMFYMKREKLAKIWLPFIIFTAILLPIQYLSCVGLPPFLCTEYPWEDFNQELKVWLFLPEIDKPPQASRLIPDFFLLLFAAQQQSVFSIERNNQSDFPFPGGNNNEISEMSVSAFANPTPDFLSTSRSWLDFCKKCLFLSFFWVTLAIIFLTGTNRVNLFALGYLVGSFIFLWEGNEFYLRSKRSIIKRWNYLLAYNVFVIFSKSFLQLIGCVFLASLKCNFCWFIQLFGIACLNKFSGVSSTEFNVLLADSKMCGGGSKSCEIPNDEAGMVWDGITFAFLIFQRRIFNSYYFFHIRTETEVQAQLASRGAELIEELMQKQIKQQEDQEKEVLEKIKMKMDRIKATHQKGRPKGPQNHFDESRMDPASSMVSVISMDETPVIDSDAKASPLAPLAPHIFMGITSGSGPTMTPSSACQTISVDGFFEPPYGRNPKDALQPPHLPLSPSDESFPVFSPPPFDRQLTGGGREATTGVGVQTSPPQRYYPVVHSPALSHHTSIRSGDYYMFDENEDDDLEMIDSITEEEDDEDERERPPGVTLSELMRSALKTDVESAAEMARLARRSSEAREASLTESTTATSSLVISRRRSRKRMSRKSALSFRSERQKLRKMKDKEGEEVLHAPLAVSDGEGGSSADPGGGGDDGRQPSTSVQPIRPPVIEPEEPPSGPTLMRRIIGYLRFAWAFLESLMISATAWLNKFSRDYRHVSMRLAEEKLALKEKECSQPLGVGPNLLVGLLPSLSQREPPRDRDIEKEREEDSSKRSKIGESCRFDGELTKQKSEDSELGGSGELDAASKDDLETVIEKPSTTHHKIVHDDSTSSLDDVSLSEVEEHEHNALVLLVVSVWYVIISHSDLVCYFVVFLNQIKSASILSLPLPIMVLLWGSLSVPRPTKTFWVTIIAYTEALVVIKYMFQFDFFPWNANKQAKTGPFWPPKILGIEKNEKYAVYDVTLLMVVFFHRFMLKSLGLWKNKSGSEGSGEYASQEKEPIASKPNNKSHCVEASASYAEGDDKEHSVVTTASGTATGCAQVVWEQWHIQESLSYSPQLVKLCVLKYLSSIKMFFDQILNLEYKVKVDVYSYMFICDFFNFLVVIFGFASFGTQTGDVSAYLEENKVPVPFLVMVILQFALIVIDRALYLRKYILGKFFFQIFLATLVHIAMFFILPAVTEREFNTALPPQMWYMVKCIYLLFSAYQIRSGYPTRILGNFLCKKYNYVNMFLFKGFMAVPFLFELRALMDWIWTDTSMTLSDWLKLEDIFAHIFQLKCQRRVEKEYPQGRGMPKQRWSKYAIGGSSLFTVIAIIWFPLVLFALGNTVGLPNPPTDLSLELTVGSYQPVFTMSVQNTSIKGFTERDFENFNYYFSKDKVGQNFLGSYDHEDVALIRLSGNSSSVWGISPPAKEKLIGELVSNLPVSVRISWTISRKDASTPQTAVARGNDEIKLKAKDENRERLISMINGTNDIPVTIIGIFPKFLKVANSGKATVGKQLNQGLADIGWRRIPVWDEPTGAEKNQTVLRNLNLKLRKTENTTAISQEWWEVEENCTPDETKNDLPLGDQCQNLNIYTFSDKTFPPTLSFISGGGIIGLYTTLVLVASKFVRGFFSGISFLIMFDDMPNVDRIFQLCLDIYLVRESGELALEEDLFAKLIFLYRSPETLIKWTRPKTIRQTEHPEDGQHSSIIH